MEVRNSPTERLQEKVLAHQAMIEAMTELFLQEFDPPTRIWSRINHLRNGDTTTEVPTPDLSSITANYNEIRANSLQTTPVKYLRKACRANAEPFEALENLNTLAAPINQDFRTYANQRSRLGKHGKGKIADLSHFYVQSKNPAALDEMSQKAVETLVEHQPIENYSQLAQIVYIDALSEELFPYIPGKNETKRNLVNMLRRDFTILAWQHLSYQYSQAQIENSGRYQGRTGKLRMVLQSAINAALGETRSGGVMINPNFDSAMISPGIQALAQSDMVKQRPKERDYLLRLMGAVLMVTSLKMGRYGVGLITTEENDKRLQDLEESNPLTWENASFSRSAPSVAKYINGFSASGESLPIIMHIDPAPKGNYVAAMSLHMSDLEASEESLTTYSRPFNYDNLRENRAVLNFYVTADGELVSYGHSQKYIENLCGGPEAYTRLQRLAKVELLKFVHAQYESGTYPPKSGSEELSETSRVSSHGATRRLGPHEEGESIDRPFTGYPAHARILPRPYKPSLQAFKKAQDQGAIQLHAYVFHDEACKQTPISQIKLDTSRDNNYFQFLDSLETIEADFEKDGLFVRFQTYVKSSK